LSLLARRPVRQIVGSMSMAVRCRGSLVRHHSACRGPQAKRVQYGTRSGDQTGGASDARSVQLGGTDIRPAPGARVNRREQSTTQHAGTSPSGHVKLGPTVDSNGGASGRDVREVRRSAFNPVPPPVEPRLDVIHPVARVSMGRVQGQHLCCTALLFPYGRLPARLHLPTRRVRSLSPGAPGNRWQSPDTWSSTPRPRLFPRLDTRWSQGCLARSGARSNGSKRSRSHFGIGNLAYVTGPPSGSKCAPNVRRQSSCGPSMCACHVQSSA
jgi:hypothetical protein